MNLNNLDKNIDVNMLEKFLENVEDDYIPTLSERGINPREYAQKLASLATICYEMDEDKIVAIVAGYTKRIEKNTSFITIVGCLKEYRRGGITNRLMKEYLAICEQMKIEIVRTTTSVNNMIAQKFYENAGFTRYEGRLEWGEPEKIHYRIILN